MRTIEEADQEILKEFFARRRRLGWENGTDFLMVSPLGFAGFVDGKQLPLDECLKASKRQKPHVHGPECKHEHS